MDWIFDSQEHDLVNKYNYVVSLCIRVSTVTEELRYIDALRPLNTLEDASKRFVDQVNAALALLHPINCTRERKIHMVFDMTRSSEMDSGALVSSEKEEGKEVASYTYWVRKITEDAAPVPVPRKLSPEDVPPCQSHSATLGSAWNRAGTWEEKSLNNWATPRIKELLISLGSMHFSFGRAEIEDVTKCVGDAFMVIVRNKKRVGYTYELTLKVNGEWTIQGEKKLIGGHIDFPEFSFGELDDLQMEVRLSEIRDILHEYKTQICNDLKLFLQPVREKLLQFEEELRDR
ncbi:hypothetical protein Fmac_030380 [Flemingia macrophylla]|uniref:Activator of Hsp90 ATPase AHSA1-like N-terminal domain-containing protein n=1 Tax=Flemingia macrophylla TaxID=520843 RepID=A0ABD1LD66_9FABA